MSTTLLDVRGAALAYSGREVVHNVTFTVSAGEHLVIAGPSGAGKSSLLRAIAGLTPLASGSVHIGNVDVTHRPAETRGAVYLHQVPILFKAMSVLENVMFPLRIRGVSRVEAARKAAVLLERVQLLEYAERRVGALSGGQRHRVALARALAAAPAVLLLDEPFSALDPQLRREVRDAVLQALPSDGPATLIVTHDIDEAVGIGGRLGILLTGRLVQCDAASVVLSRPASVDVARLLGIANIIGGVAGSDGSFTCPLGRFAGWGGPGAGALVARPLAIHVSAFDDAAGIREVRGVLTAHIHQVSGDLVKVQVGDIFVWGVPAAGLALPLGALVQVCVDRHRVHAVPNN